MTEFLVNAGNFEWADPNGKNGTISFGQQGQLSTNFNGNLDNGSWEVDDSKTITIKFAKQGDKTLQMSNVGEKGQQWNVIRPKKSTDARLLI